MLSQLSSCTELSFLVLEYRRYTFWEEAVVQLSSSLSEYVCVYAHIHTYTRISDGVCGNL